MAVKVGTGGTIETYIAALDKIWSTGIAREHAYRPTLAELLQEQLEGTTPVNEPAQIECGSPDFVVLNSCSPLGYIDSKDFGANLAELIES